MAGEDRPRRWPRMGLLAGFAMLFVLGAGLTLRTYLGYEAGRATYDGAVEAYQVQVRASPDVAGVLMDTDESEAPEAPPIVIDFAALTAAAPDVQAWLYCEGTAIDYPVVQGRNNGQYLRHDYTGGYAVSGSIFIESANRAGFQDCNTVIYGHNMKDGSMFADLQKWADQEYYDDHKTMWLLTPDQDYRIELFAGYVTLAGSDAYVVFQEPSERFDAYLERLPGKSDFVADPGIELDGGGKYVLLSTCDYMFKNARYVLHGKLVPLA